MHEARQHHHRSYWQSVWDRYKKHKLGMAAMTIVALFCLVGIYAPFLASSKPFIVYYEGSWYFPLFRYLFYTGYFTKRIDIFFNLLIFTFPLFILALWLLRKRKKAQTTALLGICLLQGVLFLYFFSGAIKDPAADNRLGKERQEVIQEAIKKNGQAPFPSWEFDLAYMNDYAKLDLILKHLLRFDQHERLKQYTTHPATIPTLWHRSMRDRIDRLELLSKMIDSSQMKGTTDSYAYKYAVAKRQYIIERTKWILEQMGEIQYLLMPMIRTFHWEDDAGGDQSFNKEIPWWELTRINRKDLVAALIFGIRISLVVGVTAVALALIIGVPIGSFAGYYGGAFDIIVSRILEIWESMPTFFMLLFVVAITQSKSIFLIITVIGVFGWTSFSRYVRGEFFKQRNLSYVEACHASGFHDSYIIFTHILPNAIPPLLTLLPFAIMGAITSEAGLSFLGLGEEGSCSWGVLMDEGRSAFPGESYLLWPPAILLTTLLIAIALVGDALRDALDPKLLR